MILACHKKISSFRALSCCTCKIEKEALQTAEELPQVLPDI